MTKSKAPALEKVSDERHTTRGGGVIRVETWQDPKTRQLVKYNMAYVNHLVYAGDNGRVLGYDNAHPYPGFSSWHHEHHRGVVKENTTFVSVDDQLARFELDIGSLKQQLGPLF